MTIRITVTHSDLGPGPIEVQTIAHHPEKADVNSIGKPLTIQPGASETFYVHSHQSVVVSERVPDYMRGGAGEEAPTPVEGTNNQP